MRNTQKNIGWVLGAAMAIAALPASAGVFADLDSFMSMDGNSMGQALYVSYAIKVNERYTIVPEIFNSISYRDGGVNKTTLAHDNTRITIANKGLIGDLGDWKSDLATRYYPPTDAPLQKQGSFGVLSFRPSFSRTWANFELGLRPMLNINLQRNGYAVNTTPKKLPSGKPEGNQIAGIGFDPVFTYKFTDKLSLNGELFFMEYFYLLDGVTGSDGNPTRTTHRISQTYELSYAVIDGTNVGVYVDHDNRWGGAGQEFKIFSKVANLGLSLDHQF